MIHTTEQRQIELSKIRSVIGNMPKFKQISVRIDDKTFILVREGRNALEQAEKFRQKRIEAFRREFIEGKRIS